MNHHYLPSQELIYCLYQRVKQCLSDYPKDFLQTQYDELFAEHYKMERDIFTWMVREILHSGEYTLEEIAHYIHLPIDLLSDAAMGLQKDISMTLWIKIADLFLQVKDKIPILVNS